MLRKRIANQKILSTDAYSIWAKKLEEININVNIELRIGEDIKEVLNNIIINFLTKYGKIGEEFVKNEIKTGKEKCLIKLATDCSCIIYAENSWKQLHLLYRGNEIIYKKINYRKIYVKK